MHSQLPRPPSFASRLVDDFHSACDQFKEAKGLDAFDLQVGLAGGDVYDVYCLGTLGRELILMFAYEEGAKGHPSQPFDPTIPDPHLVVVAPGAISYFHVSSKGSGRHPVGFRVVEEFGNGEN